MKMVEIKSYQCEKAFKVTPKSDYLEFELKSEQNFSSVELIRKNKDFEGAFILGFRALQLLGNAVLIKKFGLRSKVKGCQFQMLFQKSIFSDEDVENLNKISTVRNDIYYNNNIFEVIDEEKFEELIRMLYEIKDKLKKEL